jgi:hypothetical protein
LFEDVIASERLTDEISHTNRYFISFWSSIVSLPIRKLQGTWRF